MNEPRPLLHEGDERFEKLAPESVDDRRRPADDATLVDRDRDREIAMSQEMPVLHCLLLPRAPDLHTGARRPRPPADWRRRGPLSRDEEDRRLPMREEPVARLLTGIHCDSLIQPATSEASRRAIPPGRPGT